MVNRKMSPGAGEQRALSGYHPQFKFFAGRVLAALDAGNLVSVGVSDPDAGTLDDAQIVSLDEVGNRVLHAYQVKWSTSATVNMAETLSLLADAIESYALLTAGETHPDRGTIDRVIGHIVINRIPSNSPARASGPSKGLKPSSFVAEVWNAIVARDLPNVDAIASVWRPLWKSLADSAGLSEEKLFDRAQRIHFEIGAKSPESDLVEGSAGAQFKDDLKDVVWRLYEISSGREDAVWIGADDLVRSLGARWKSRWETISSHSFEVPGSYEEITTTAGELRRAVSELDGGYVCLTGSPGSGKSTLLTDAFRADPRVVARYYAFVPGDDTAVRGEEAAFLGDLLVQISRYSHTHRPSPDPRFPDLLRTRFREELIRLGAEAVSRNSQALLVLDGLDHVLRDPQPSKALLSSMPPDNEIPKGVVIVVGTRNESDLPTQISTFRTVSYSSVAMRPLSRFAIQKMASREGLAELGSRINESSRGHPLLVRTLLNVVAEASPSEREEALQDFLLADGSIVAYYDRIWSDLRNDAETRALLGLICRLRIPINRSWLSETGTDHATLERLDSMPHLFDTRDYDRWRFFHDSFREFLEHRTSDGGSDGGKSKRFHKELARRCELAEGGSVERWELVHHLVRSQQFEPAMSQATPEHFTRQLDDLRPSASVKADIRELTKLLPRSQSPELLVNLAIVDGEVNGRHYQLPHGTRFARLLVRVGRPDLAIEHVSQIDDSVHGHNSVRSAMKISLELLERGYEFEARQLFDEFEPLDWFGLAPPRERDSTEGRPQAVYSWARAAIRFRGPKYVIARLDGFEIPDSPFASAPHVEGAARRVKLYALGAAAREALSLGRKADAEVLRKAIHTGEVPGDDAEIGMSVGAYFDSREGGHELEPAIDQYLREVDPATAASNDLLDIAAVFRAMELRPKLEQCLRRLEPPQVPDYQERDGTWGDLFLYFSLKSSCSQAVALDRAIPDSEREHEFQAVITARHLARFAELDGRQRSGGSVTSAELLTAVRQLDAFWKNTDHRDRFTAVPGRRMAHEAAVRIAGRGGEQYRRALWSYWKDNWASVGYRGHELAFSLLFEFRRAGVPDSAIRAQLELFENSIRNDAEASAEDWLDIGEAWSRLTRKDEATRCLRGCVHSTHAVAFRKDYQLSDLLTLGRPAIQAAEDLPELSEWLGARICRLDRRVESGAAAEAARSLLVAVAEIDPNAALAVANRFVQHSVLDHDEVLESLLEASAGVASPRWWAAATNIHVALGAERRGDWLERGVRATAEPERLTRLNEMLSSVAVFGRPSARIAWRESIVSAVADLGIPRDALNLTERHLTPSDNSPIETVRSETDESAETVRPTFAALLASAESGDRDYRLVSQLIERIGEADQSQLLTLDDLFTGSEDASRMMVARAQYEIARDDFDAGVDFAVRALATSDGRDWSRYISGGSAQKAAAILAEHAPEALSETAYESIARAASVDDFLFSSIYRELDSIVKVMNASDNPGIARTCLAYACSLLREEDEEAVDLNLISTPPRQAPPHSDEWRRAWNSVIVEMLKSPFELAWTSARRAVRELIEDCQDLLALAISDDGVPLTRIAPIVELAAHATVPIDPAVIAALDQRCTDDHLDNRLAAASALATAGINAGVTHKRDLPASLRLEIPSTTSDRHSIYRPEYEEPLEIFESDLSHLAKLSQLDRDAIVERVRKFAAIENGLPRGDGFSASDEGVYGWKFVRPSVARVRGAISRVSAELVDAEKLSSPSQVFGSSVWPAYDVSIISADPVERPSEIASTVPWRSRTSHFSEWFTDIDTPENRLTREIGAWSVVGEATELRLLSRQNCYERRYQALLGSTAPEDGLFDYSSSNITAANHRFELEASVTDRGVVRGFMGVTTAPDSWTAFAPSLAARLGLTPSPSSDFAWDLEGERVVDVIWWRSGFSRWTPRSESDEVGDGWLVIVAPDLARKLAHIGYEIRWKVVSEMGDDEIRRSVKHGSSRIEHP